MIWRLTKIAFKLLALTILLSVSGMAVATKLQGGNLLSVQTKSMMPVLNKGDLVSATRVPVERLAVGDIVTFINPKDKRTTITHRIIELPSISNAKMFVTKGDANSEEDIPIESTLIIGRMRYSVPYIGYGADFIRRPLGLILIIYIPALGIIIGEMRRLSAYYKAQQPYTARGRKSKLIDISFKKKQSIPALKLLPLVLLIPLILAAPVYAALSTRATLTGNTITASRPSTQVCTGTGNSTAATVNITGSGGSSNNNSVNVSNSSNQNAQSGDATVSNNTNGGSATSGNAINCNSTNINISITNP